MSAVKVYTDLEQGTPEWLQARCGVVTASVIGDFITPKTLKVANNDTARKRALSLAAERVSGHVNETRMTDAMWRGVEDEPKARAWYVEHYGPVDEIGFMVRDIDGAQVGYSPDGMVGDVGLIEIKSRDQRVQMETWLASDVPAYNLAQLHCGMWISDRAWCDYISFAEGWPVYVKRVYRDRVWDQLLHDAALAAEEQITAAVATYKQLTDGLPVVERTPDIDEIRF